MIKTYVSAVAWVSRGYPRRLPKDR
jgi:periodic tryptophan protein 1